MTTLLPLYHFQQVETFTTWVMYLESILKEVYSYQGTESVLLEALNYLAMTIYFSDMVPQGFFPRDTSMPSPGSINNSFRESYGRDSGHDRDQFTKVCSKINEI